MVVSQPGAQRASAANPGFTDRIVDASRRAARITLAAVLVAFIGGVVAAGAPGAASAAEGRLKAVVIVGPTDGMTDEYLRWGEVIARTAERNGMQVARIYHPRALWSRVKEETRGANLVVYLGHGFGWPSPYPKSLFESQMDGLGLNYPDPARRSRYETHYYGAAKIRKRLQLAPNAVVILNHLCYASGHGEMHHSRPTRDVAIRRVDNFANGFLKVGARVVFALAFQPGETIVGALFGRGSNTMEDLFRRRFSSGGWNGWKPSRHESVRTPGARLLLDPSRSQSYRRAITGDLQMTVKEWRTGAAPAS